MKTIHPLVRRLISSCQPFTAAPSIALLALALAAVTARAQLDPVLIFQDTFEVSMNSADINLENDQGRQTGPAAPLTYADNTAFPDFTQVNYPFALGTLYIFASDEQNVVAVSPNRNFTDGPRFTIEFDVDAGMEDPDGFSDDWAAVVFGATQQNVSVNASDGMGILFRNNGEIQVFDGGASVYSGDGEFPGGIPREPIHVRIEVDAADFSGSPATVRLFINDTQVRIGGGEGLEHVKAAGFQDNFMTLLGSAFGGNFWSHTFDNLSVTAVPCIAISATTANLIRGESSDSIDVTIPAQLNSENDATVRVVSSNPDIAVPAGAGANGELELAFTAGGSTVQTFTIEALAAGQATFSLQGPEGVCVAENIAVSVANGPGFPELVFEDTFDTSTGSFDINFENDQGRQSGSAAVLNYVESEASAAGGVADEFTQVNPFEFPGKLMIMEQNVSPDHNFIEGASFTIEFEVDPGANNPFRDLDQWAAVVFGATSPNQFVISQDGFGILFRNDGRIEVWDASTRVFGSEFEDALPPQPNLIRIEVENNSFNGNSPAIIRMFVNDVPTPIAPDGMEYIRPNGFQGNYLSLLGIGENLMHTFDTLRVTSDVCVHASATELNFGPGENEAEIEVRVPSALIADAPATVRLISRNPAVASLAGAVDGELTLTFEAGGPAALPVTVEVRGKGSTLIDLATDHLVCLADPIAVNIRTTLLRNPSFEQNPPAAFPTYGPVAQWQTEGGSGVNTSAGPFHDNGTIPDRSQVGFVQNAGRLFQQISGLEAGESYWLQFRYNARNCCGGTINATVRFDGQDLHTLTDVQPVGANPYHFAQVVITPDSDSGLLEFVTTSEGDAAFLLDAVTLVKRGEGNVMVRNPSFETSGNPPWPGYVQPDLISGWTGEGSYGVNVSGAGPFADNGLNTDQDSVAFIQGMSSLSQTISGLVPGESYTLSYSYNARSGNQPNLVVTLGDFTALDAQVDPAGPGTDYHVGEHTFTADSGSALLTFAQTAEGDQTVLIDDIQITGQSSNLPCIVVDPSTFSLTISQVATATLTIPAELTAGSDAQVTVRSTDPNVVLPVGAEGDSLTLTFAAGGDTTQTFDFVALGQGTASLELSNPHGVCFDNAAITVSASGSLINNPSFEANPAGGFPGYGAIAGWKGGSGLNNSDGPFHDNGLIPDRNQIAFLQGATTLSQEVGGLEAGEEYRLQFHYNARNCCGGSIDLAVLFNGVEIDFIPNIVPVLEENPYIAHTVTFTPDTAGGTLQFVTTAAGDATVLLDAVTLVQRDPDQALILNASFEASGNPPFPGYIQPASISGWLGTGNYGVNVSGEGPFADNGRNSDQDSVLFLQDQNSSLTQLLQGLTVGESYTLSYEYNARSGNNPHLLTTIGGAVAHDASITPVGGNTPYPTRHFGFTADSDVAELVFTQTAGGDHTVLIDNVRLAPGEAPVEVRLQAEVAARNTILISWPAGADSFVLQSADAVGGQWENVSASPVLNGDRLEVPVPASGQAGFYRLIEP